MKSLSRRWVLLSTAAIVALASVAAIGAAEGSGEAPQQLAADGRLRDGSFPGPAIDTHWGPVQVRATIRDGRLAAVDVPIYPNDRRASVRINSRALPMLESEAIRAQSARVNIVSGATLTSEAYLRSLDAALRSAGAAPQRLGT